MTRNGESSPCLSTTSTAKPSTLICVLPVVVPLATLQTLSLVDRGMGSPIPSQEGAWVREDPRVVGGGYDVWSVDPLTWNHEGTWLRHTP